MSDIKRDPHNVWLNHTYDEKSKADDRGRETLSGVARLVEEVLTFATRLLTSKLPLFLVLMSVCRFPSSSAANMKTQHVAGSDVALWKCTTDSQPRREWDRRRFGGYDTTYR